MYSYKIYKEISFIVVKLENGTLEHIFEVFNKIREDSDFNHGYNGLVDLRHSLLSLEIKDLHQVATYIHDSQWVKGAWVLLNDKPENTVISMLYKELTHTFHSIDVCSTTEKASELLDIDITNYI